MKEMEREGEKFEKEEKRYECKVVRGKEKEKELDEKREREGKREVKEGVGVPGRKKERGGEGSGGGELNEEEWEKNRPRGWGEGA